MLRWIKDRIRRHIAGIAAKEATRAVEEVYARLPQLIAFHTAGPEARQEKYDQSKSPESHLDDYARQRAELVRAGVTVEDVRVEIGDFEKWMKDFSAIRAFYDKTMGNSAVQKCMEHYLAHRWLDIKPGAVYVDVAAQFSPWAKLLRERGVKAYRLDMDYPAGTHGMDIGADACATGLPDGFADSLSAQCAYNCFAGDADIRFLREASRILNAKGRLAILPLCVGDTYCIYRSPYCDLGNIQFDAGAKLVWRSDRFRLPFSRQYSPVIVRQRLVANLPPDLRAKVVFISNLAELIKHFAGQRIHGCFNLYCEKVAAPR